MYGEEVKERIEGTRIPKIEGTESGAQLDILGDVKKGYVVQIMQC